MFFKKEETIDSLTKECNELVASFKYSYSKAHSKSYFHFKQKFSGNLPIIKFAIENAKEDESVLILLKWFKEQLSFFKKNPFSSSIEDMIEFESKFSPVDEKIKVLLEKNNINTKNISKKIF